MIMLLVVAIVADVVLHGAIIYRFGVKGNEPPLLFGILYVALAAALAYGLPYALWAALILPIVGTIGLVAGYKSIPHEKTIERLILALNAAIILFTAYLVFMP